MVKWVFHLAHSKKRAPADLQDWHDLVVPALHARAQARPAAPGAQTKCGQRDRTG